MNNKQEKEFRIWPDAFLLSFAAGETLAIRFCACMDWQPQPAAFLVKVGAAALLMDRSASVPCAGKGK
jgi:hypothetical protein